MAKHIVACNVDTLLAGGSPEAVELIAKVRLADDSKERHLYSFASKYCSWHNPAEFPIYDSRARNTLWKYRRQDKFHDFSSEELWCYNGYGKFREIVDAFRDYYGLREFSFKEIDKFLYWFDLLGTYDIVPIAARQAES